MARRKTGGQPWMVPASSFLRMESARKETGQTKRNEQDRAKEMGQTKRRTKFWQVLLG